MYPWLWIWAPAFHFPFSGSVAQEIAPDTDWFFDAIPPAAGDGRLEQKIVEVASYGRQLGLISEIVLALADGKDVKEGEARQALERLKAIDAEIEAIKVADNARVAEAAIVLLRKLGKSDRAQLHRVLELVSAEPPQIAYVDAAR
jgi:hypothetical protein